MPIKDNILDIEGTAMYAKVLESFHDKGSSVAEGAKYDYPEAYNLAVIVDHGTIKELEGAFNFKPQLYDDGLGIKFNRNKVNPVNPAWGGAPAVVDATGEPWDQNVMIGNGSKVRIAAEIYPTKRGNYARLMKVMVLEHVPFEGEEKPEPDLPF